MKKEWWKCKEVSHLIFTQHFTVGYHKKSQQNHFELNGPFPYTSEQNNKPQSHLSCGRKQLFLSLHLQKGNEDYGSSLEQDTHHPAWCAHVMCHGLSYNQRCHLLLYLRITFQTTQTYQGKPSSSTGIYSRATILPCS